MMDNKIKILTQINSSASIAGDRSIENAFGRFIVSYDFDDIWASEKLDFLVKFMVKNKLNFTFSLYQKFKNKK